MTGRRAGSLAIEARTNVKGSTRNSERGSVRTFISPYERTGTDWRLESLAEKCLKRNRILNWDKGGQIQDGLADHSVMRMWGTRSDGLIFTSGSVSPFRRQGQCTHMHLYSLQAPFIHQQFTSHSRLRFSVCSGCFPCPPDAASESRFLTKVLFSCCFHFFESPLFPLLLQKYLFL
jgi:hypothetical protein